MCLYPGRIRPRGAALLAENVLSPRNSRVAGFKADENLTAGQNFIRLAAGYLFGAERQDYTAILAVVPRGGGRGNGVAKQSPCKSFLLYIYSRWWN